VLTYQATPFEEIHHDILDKAEIRLVVKREDLNHPYVSGNKWWKLKYNLEMAVQEGKKLILTFGGAYSNHIYATSSAANELGMQSIGIIRGEETLPLNTTLLFAQQMGMRLHYTSRKDYHRKTEPSFIQKLKDEFGDFFLIPEGGSNELAVLGVEEFTRRLEISADYICCPVGTGGTLAGIIRGLEGKKRVVGFSTLKDGSFLNEEVAKLVKQDYTNWELVTEYHFGGYAKSTPGLLRFIEDFKHHHHIPLDFIYTGKMMFGIIDLATRGFFDRGSTVVAIHTGGIR
jgi:1-aminocyclopropane-1-carboxylate deaminase